MFHLPIFDLFSCVCAALYSIILFCVFLWIPFVYFYYEERDDDNVNKCSVRMRVSSELRQMTGSSKVGINKFYSWNSCDQF